MLHRVHTSLEEYPCRDSDRSVGSWTARISATGTVLRHLEISLALGVVTVGRQVHTSVSEGPTSRDPLRNTRVPSAYRVPMKPFEIASADGGAEVGEIAIPSNIPMVWKVG